MDTRLGMRVWKRGFSDQWGESEISTIEDCRLESLERRTCHRPMKDLTERDERRRKERSWVMTSRVGLDVDDGDAGPALGCIWPRAQASTGASRRQAQAQPQSQSQVSNA